MRNRLVLSGKDEETQRWRKRTATSLLVFLVGSHLASAYVSYLGAASYRRVNDLRSYELTVNEAFTSLAVAESAQRGYVSANLTELGAIVPSQLAATRNSLRQVQSVSVRQPKLQEQFESLESAFLKKISWMDRVHTKAHRDRTSAARMIRTGQGKSLMDEVEAQMDRLHRTESKILAEEDERARLYAGIDVFSSLLFVALSIALSLTLIRLRRRVEATEAEVRRLREERTLNLEKEVARRTAQLNLVNGDLEAFSSVTAGSIGRELAELDEILKRTADSAEIVEARSHIDQLQRTLALIQQLSKLSRERSPASPVDLAKMVRSAVAAKQADQPLASLKLTVPDSLPVRTNERGMRILFRALVDSAWLEMRNESAPALEFACDEVEGRTVFAFRYGSQGKLPIDLMALLSNQAGKDDRLLSIAAAIAQRVIQRIGGELWFDAMSGRRTNFYFTLDSLKD